MTTSPARDASVGLAGAVLVGGKNSRMGADKAALEIAGRPMVDIVAAALRGAGASPILAIGRSEDRSISPEVDEWVPDPVPGQGPLGGILTALGSVDTRHVAVLACDIPAATSREIIRLVGAIGDADVALAVVDGRRQYLHAVWNQRAEHRLAASFDAGERSIHRALAELRVVEVEPLDPTAISDVDTPEELRTFLNDR